MVMTAGEKARGIERHLLVDTRGTVLLTCVDLGSVGDRDSAVVLFARAADLCLAMAMLLVRRLARSTR